jgi:hypothetical protein
MLGPALGWLGVARACFRDPRGGLLRGLLTSVFALVVGLERVFHLDEMEDTGFAVLTGGRRCPERTVVGGWRRHLPWYEVDAFCRRTSPWHLIRGEAALLSYDEHAIPRWTHKYHIPKGHVTTRNKYMRCEKLFYTYDLLHGRYLAVRATPGDWGLDELAIGLLRQTLERGRPDFVHALFDAGAGPSDAAVRTLWDLVEQEHPRLDVTLRACRHPHRVRLWKALPARRGRRVPGRSSGRRASGRAGGGFPATRPRRPGRLGVPVHSQDRTGSERFRPGEHSGGQVPRRRKKVSSNGELTGMVFARHLPCHHTQEVRWTLRSTAGRR